MNNIERTALIDKINTLSEKINNIEIELKLHTNEQFISCYNKAPIENSELKLNWAKINSSHFNEETRVVNEIKMLNKMEESLITRIKDLNCFCCKNEINTNLSYFKEILEIKDSFNVFDVRVSFDFVKLKQGTINITSLSIEDIRNGAHGGFVYDERALNR